MSTEADNDTQCELAAWELLKEARQELADYKASAERARDTITQAFLRVAEERDKAQEKVAELESMRENWRLSSVCRELQRERDEARQLARELRDALQPILAALVGRMVIKDTDTVERAHSALSKAKEVLP